MAMFRLQNKTPEVYTAQSRDFQLLCRSFDCVNSGIREDILSMVRILDTNNCMNRMMKLLQTKLGFFTSHEYNDDDIREVLIGFLDMVKNKGTKKAIEQAIYVFLRATKTNAIGFVQVYTDRKTVSIGLSTRPSNMSLLDEILAYIIPTGFFIEYFYYTEYERLDKMSTTDTADMLKIEIQKTALVSVNKHLGGNLSNVPITFFNSALNMIVPQNSDITDPETVFGNPPEFTVNTETPQVGDNPDDTLLPNGDPQYQE